MNIKFYFDEMMAHKVAASLRERGYTIVMAVEAEMTEKDDLTQHLVYATANEMVLVTQDKPFAGRAMENSDHAGVICWTGKQDDIGSIIRKLDEFAQIHENEDIKGQVFWLK